jgi:hypothetical protein
MTLKLLWPTPVWEIETPELSDIVSPLLEDIKTKNPFIMNKVDMLEVLSKFVSKEKFEIIVNKINKLKNNKK